MRNEPQEHDPFLILLIILAVGTLAVLYHLLIQ
jgi:hypothetical protein